MAMVYFNRKKEIKNIVINYNSRNEGFVKQIENILIDIAKQMKIDLKNPIGNDKITVYIHPSKEYFKKIFAGTLEQREKYGSKAQMNLIVTGDEIHVLVESEAGSTALAKLIVTKIFAEFIDPKKVVSVEKAAVIKIEAEKNKKSKKVIEEESEEELEEQPEEIDELEEEVVDDENLSEEELEKIEELYKPDEDVEQDIEKIEEVIEKKEVVIPSWLEDGWYEYKRGYMNKVRSEDLGNYLQGHKITKVEKLSDSAKIFKKYDMGHELKCTRVEYILEIYGIKKLRKFFEDPDIRSVFKITKRQFDEDWKKYLKEKYVNKAMVEIKGKNITKEKDKIISE